MAAKKYLRSEKSAKKLFFPNDIRCENTIISPMGAIGATVPVD